MVTVARETAHGGAVDEREDALVGVDQDVAERGEDDVEIRGEGERGGDEIGIWCFRGGEGGVG